ncbi:GDP-L-fucose synthase family protein [Paenarthrobacter sp. NPDC056912]|uniref:GDP-L-fucose synthase family protein n=1 Tax=Paenarthrobacter sp. NPDC056912 TaxID=3345965 RepID=UPI00366C2FF1
MTAFTPGRLDRSAAFYVAGHRGLVGSALWRRLAAEGFTNMVGRTSLELDLRNRSDVFAFFEKERPRYVAVAAAKVGGILANQTYPAEFLSENVQIQVNVLDAAQKYGVERLLFLGSSCIYPRLAPQPLKEEYLLTGPLEKTNEAYAIAKISGILQVQSVRRQYGLPWISAMPTNLYGPGDNFSKTGSHVLPALIRRFDEARAGEEASVTNWGTGAPRREFLHVDDLADACLYLLEHYDAAEHVNVGVGADLTIKDLAEMIAATVGYEGALEWDAAKPDGTPRKLMDVSKLESLGWSARIPLEEGIASTYAWFNANRNSFRN